MFERFAGPARQVVVLAQQDARQLHHRTIGTEHLLIGLAGQGGDPAAAVLRKVGITAAGIRRRVEQLTGDALDPAALAALGIDLDRVRRAAEERFGAGALDSSPRGREPKGHIPLSNRAKKVLELSLRAARELRADSISTGHLLIGIIDEGDGLAVRVLQDSGVDLAELRADTVILLGGGPAT